VGVIAFPPQSQSAEQISIKQNGDRLGLAFVSKAVQPLGLEQGAVAIVISARSDMQRRAITFRDGGFVGGRLYCPFRASHQSTSISGKTAIAHLGQSCAPCRTRRITTFSFVKR
jgi:hypothetical protein